MSDAVELLREASRLMRSRAQEVRSGPWEAETTERGNAWINVPGAVHAWGMHGFPEEARHVAAFASPVVALALADWLDAEAALHEEAAAADAGVRVATGNRWQVRMEASTLIQAVAVAAAYLGEVSP